MEIIEKFDKLAHQIEVRRNHILREIDRFRDNVSRRFRLAIENEEVLNNNI